MNWKQFRNMFKKEAFDEDCFILGIDLGNDSSIVSYYNVLSGQPEVLDISGGYGKPSVPTVMQWVNETKEWVFGEYAVLNMGMGIGKEVTLTSLVEKLGKKEYVEIDKKSLSIVNVLAIYLKELIGNVLNINPKAEIVGIVASIPSYFGDEAKHELTLAFKAAGYEKELIGLFTDRTCIFSRFFFKNPITREKIMVLDYGSREMRGGVYDVVKDHDGIDINCISSLFDDSIGTKRINSAVTELFCEYYAKNANTPKEKLNSQIRNQIDVFMYQHKDLLFQKNIGNKNIRLYFNFAYPPFQVNMTKADVDRLIYPFANGYKKFINNVLAKHIYSGVEKISYNEIDRIICIGGGFEMMWAKKCVEELFPDSQIAFYKNAKTVISEGAAIVAAASLGVISMDNIYFSDKNQLTSDFGIKVVSDRKDRKDRFIPIIEKNSFWWQSHMPKMILVNEKTDKPISIPIYKRDSHGDIFHLTDVVLDDLPNRPRGTTKIKMAMEFESFGRLSIKASDYGFGEMFPADLEYERHFKVEVN